jgi:hypothetical protein
MSRRAARIASAIFVNILASLPLVMMARGETATAENCLANPKNETPAGSHWYYRVDHANKRNCWYLRSEGGVAQAVPQTEAPAPAAKPSYANARAELRPQASVREDTAPSSTPTSPVIGAAAGSTTGSANTSVWNATAAVATRWPESPPASTPKPASTIPDPAINVAQADAVAPAAASPVAAIANLPVSIQPEMIPILIAAAIGALLFAGVAVLISRRYRRRVRRRKATAARGPIWETTDDDRIVLSDYPSRDEREYQPRFARGVASATSRYRAPEVVQRTPRRARR